MHSPTLLILAAILMGIMTAMLTAVWRFNRQIDGFGTWTLSYFFGSLFCVSLLLRGAVPEIASVAAAQLCVFLMAYLNLAGIRAYVGAPALPLAYPLLGAASLLAATAYFTLLQPDGGMRFALSSLVIGCLFLLSAHTIAKGKLQEYPARFICAVTCAGHGVFLLLRPWLFTLGRDGLFDAAQAITVSQFVVVESIVAIVLMAFGVVMLANERITHELRRIADRDPLTGTFNRRSFLSLLDKSISTAARMKSPLAILVVDLDHFKKINDTWGHQAGDEALRHFVGVAGNCIRHGDTIGRMGGEEFALFLPHTGFTEAQAVAGRLRAAVEAQPLSHAGATIGLTVSIGVARWLPGETAEATLHRADAAMYRAKRNGRNRVEQATKAAAPATGRQPDSGLEIDLGSRAG